MSGSLLRIVIGLVLLSSALSAQTSFSTVRGTTSDPTGAVVAGADITLLSLDTGARRELKTDQNGNFEILDLPRGKYRLTANAVGFTAFVADDIILESSQIRRFNVAFQLGKVGTEVTVTAGAAVITTDSARIQGEFTKKVIEDAPSLGDGRNPALVLGTLPFVQNRNSLWSVTFAGQPTGQTQQGIDGFTSDGVINQISNIHDVQEIVAIAVNNTAEFARVGYYDMVQKSGVNSFHGLAGYSHDNSSLAARSFFETRKPHILFHTYMWNLSGPVWKNKTFFYFGHMGQRFPGSTFYLKDVPTQKMRQGDFSQLLGLGKPVPIRDPLTGAPFPGNIIPPGRLSSVSAKIQEKYVPVPNLSGADALTRNYYYIFPYPNDNLSTTYLTGRVDHRISDKNTIFGRWTTNWLGYIRGLSYPNLAGTAVRHSHHIVIADTHIFSPSTVNSFRLGFYNLGVFPGGTINGFTPLKGDVMLKDLGIQGVNSRGLSGLGSPIFSITGLDAIRILAAEGGRTTHDHTWGFFDSLTWSKGKHVFKFGGEYKPQSRFLGDLPDNTYGNFTFNGSLTAHPYADFFLGLPYSSQRLDPLINRTTLDSELGLFAQDTYKITNHLTLDLGLRWDHFGPSDWADGLLYNWDSSKGSVVVPERALKSVGSLYPTSTINVATGTVKENPAKGNFAPRVGAAYRLGDKTVIRGGYGVFTATNGRFTRALDGGPFQISETFFNGIQAGQPLFAFPNPFPAGAGQIASQSISGYPLDTQNGRIHQFSFSLERQFHDMGVRLSYVGSQNRGMNYNLNINKPRASLIPFVANRRPYPQFVNTTWIRADGAQHYNAFNLEVQRKIGGLTFDNHWTWSSNYLSYQSIEDPYSPLQWSREPYTTRHRVVFSVVWELPLGRGRRWLSSAPGGVDHVLGGWSLYWLGNLESGYFFTPSFSGSDPSNTNTSGGRPDRICNGNLPAGQRSTDRWFDPSCFVAPPPGRYGNSGANILEGPGYNGQNLSLLKRFKIRERLNLTFVAASENFLNHPNFGLANSNISVPGQAGVISTTKAGDFAARRKILLRMRVEF